MGHSRWMSVNNVMTKDVILVKGSDRLRDAWLIMMEADISGAPVVDESGALVGILSMTDIFRSILERVQKARSLRESSGQHIEGEALEKEEIRELSLAIRAVAESQVSSVLPKDQKVLSLSPGDSLERAIHLMAEHSVNQLPIVRDNQVIGVVTRQDVIWSIGGRPGKTS